VADAVQSKLYAEPIDIDSGVDKFFQKITSNVYTVTAVEKLTTTETTIFNKLIKVTLDKNIGLDYSKISLSIYRTVLGELVRWPVEPYNSETVETSLADKYTKIQKIVIDPPVNGETNIATVHLSPPKDDKTDGPQLMAVKDEWIRILLNDKLITNGDYKINDVGNTVNVDHYVSAAGHPGGADKNFTLKFQIKLPTTYSEYTEIPLGYVVPLIIKKLDSADNTLTVKVKNNFKAARGDMIYFAYEAPGDQEGFLPYTLNDNIERDNITNESLKERHISFDLRESDIFQVLKVLNHANGTRELVIENPVDANNASKTKFDVLIEHVKNVNKFGENEPLYMLKKGTIESHDFTKDTVPIKWQKISWHDPFIPHIDDYTGLVATFKNTKTNLSIGSNPQTAKLMAPGVYNIEVCWKVDVNGSKCIEKESGILEIPSPSSGVTPETTESFGSEEGAINTIRLNNRKSIQEWDISDEAFITNNTPITSTFNKNDNTFTFKFSNIDGWSDLDNFQQETLKSKIYDAYIMRSSHNSRYYISWFNESNTLQEADDRPDNYHESPIIDITRTVDDGSDIETFTVKVRDILDNALPRNGDGAKLISLKKYVLQNDPNKHPTKGTFEDDWVPHPLRTGYYMINVINMVDKDATSVNVSTLNLNTTNIVTTGTAYLKFTDYALSHVTTNESLMRNRIRFGVFNIKEDGTWKYALHDRNSVDLQVSKIIMRVKSTEKSPTLVSPETDPIVENEIEIWQRANQFRGKNIRLKEGDTLQLSGVPTLPLPYQTSSARMLPNFEHYNDSGYASSKITISEENVGKNVFTLWIDGGDDAKFHAPLNLEIIWEDPFTDYISKKVTDIDKIHDAYNNISVKDLSIMLLKQPEGGEEKVYSPFNTHGHIEKQNYPNKFTRVYHNNEKLPLNQILLKEYDERITATGTYFVYKDEDEKYVCGYVKEVVADSRSPRIVTLKVVKRFDKDQKLLIDETINNSTDYFPWDDDDANVKYQNVTVPASSGQRTNRHDSILFYKYKLIVDDIHLEPDKVATHVGSHIETFFSPISFDYTKYEVKYVEDRWENESWFRKIVVKMPDGTGPGRNPLNVYRKRSGMNNYSIDVYPGEEEKSLSIEWYFSDNYTDSNDKPHIKIQMVRNETTVKVGEGPVTELKYSQKTYVFDSDVKSVNRNISLNDGNGDGKIDIGEQGYQKEYYPIVTIGSLLAKLGEGDVANEIIKVRGTYTVGWSDIAAATNRDYYELGGQIQEEEHNIYNTIVIKIIGENNKPRLLTSSVIHGHVSEFDGTEVSGNLYIEDIDTHNVKDVIRQTNIDNEVSMELKWNVIDREKGNMSLVDLWGTGSWIDTSDEGEDEDDTKAHPRWGNLTRDEVGMNTYTNSAGVTLQPMGFFSIDQYGQWTYKINDKIKDHLKEGTYTDHFDFQLAPLDGGQDVLTETGKNAATPTSDSLSYLSEFKQRVTVTIRGTNQKPIFTSTRNDSDLVGIGFEDGAIAAITKVNNEANEKFITLPYNYRTHEMSTSESGNMKGSVFTVRAMSEESYESLKYHYRQKNRFRNEEISYLG